MSKWKVIEIIKLHPLKTKIIRNSLTAGTLITSCQDPKCKLSPSVWHKSDYYEWAVITCDIFPRYFKEDHQRRWSSGSSPLCGVLRSLRLLPARSHRLLQRPQHQRCFFSFTLKSFQQSFRGHVTSPFLQFRGNFCVREPYTWIVCPICDFRIARIRIKAAGKNRER